MHDEKIKPELIGYPPRPAHSVIRFALLVAALAVASTGCSKNNGSSNTTSQAPQKIAAANGAVAAKLAAEGRVTEAASEYARIGELLLMPEGIPYADKMFDRALDLDPNNGKASFYSAITKPLMKMQGFITRLGQVADPDDVKKLAQLRKDIEKLHLPELTNFAMKLPAGTAPFSNYHDVQRFLKTEVLPELVRSADKISRLAGRADLELNINLSRLGFPKTASHYDYQCYHSTDNYTDAYGGGYDRNGNAVAKEYSRDYWSCSYTSTVELKDILKAERVMLDASDLKIARGSLMALADVIRLSSAYSFEGLFEAVERLRGLSERREERGRELTAHDIILELKRHPELFRIESDQELVALARSEEQVLRDVLSLGDLQADLCQNLERQEGESLIKSFCLYADDLKNAKTALDLLAGPKPVKIGYDADGNEVDVIFNVMALINNPPTDAKALFPTAFDRKGQAVRWSDTTFGGLVPNGDLVFKLQHVVVGSPRAVEFRKPTLIR